MSHANKENPLTGSGYIDLKAGFKQKLIHFDYHQKRRNPSPVINFKAVPAKKL